MPHPDFNPLAYLQALANPLRVTEHSAWLGHIPFAMSLIEMNRPRTFVELGTLRGDSYCAFCQAIQATNSGTKAFAIDTWRGDIHIGALSDKLLHELRAHHDPLYKSFSTLIQSDFDAAVSRFEDASIDLLHIDGCHTYDAVKHDYETWLPKLSPRAVVLFHDTANRSTDFGVWKFWAEISNAHPHFEFQHAQGLGILAVGTEPPESILDFLKDANANPDPIRQYFSTLGHRIEMFSTASILINATVRIHQAIEQWHNKRNQRLQPLPHPVQETTAFADRIVTEVTTLTNRAK
jgi:hypothetical protein